MLSDTAITGYYRLFPLIQPRGGGSIVSNSPMAGYYSLGGGEVQLEEIRSVCVTMYLYFSYNIEYIFHV